MRSPRKAKSASRHRAAGFDTASIVGRDPIHRHRVAPYCRHRIAPRYIVDGHPGGRRSGPGGRRRRRRGDGGARHRIALGPAWRSLRGGEIDARIELDARLRREARAPLPSTPPAKCSAWPCSARGGACWSSRPPPSPASPRGWKRTVASPADTWASSLHPVAVEGGGAGAMVVGVDAKGPGGSRRYPSGRRAHQLGRPAARRRAAVAAQPRADSVGRTIAFELRRGGQTHQVVADRGRTACRLSNHPLATRCGWPST